MNLLTKRICTSIISVVIAGISVAFFKMSAFGVDPFQAFMNGLNSVIPINFGTFYVIVNVLLLLFSFFTDKKYIGLATFINLFLLGYVIEFSHSYLLQLFPDISMLGRVIFLLIGLIILCIASAFYIVADMGVSTYDAISLIIANSWKLIEFKYCRIISDLICVVFGAVFMLLSGKNFWDLSAIIGVGTIITAFFMGPLISFFIKHLANPFFKKLN